MISDNCALLSYLGFYDPLGLYAFLGFNALCIWGGREDSIREYLLSEGQ